MSIIETDRAKLLEIDLIKRVVNHPAVEHAFACGGYVAGGVLRFALANRDRTFTKKSSDQDVNTILSYCRRGDIDLFFPSYNSLADFHAAMVDDDRFTKSTQSWAKFADEYRLDPSGRGLVPKSILPVHKIQAITFKLQDPIKLLDGFDFSNAAIALTKDNAYVHEGFHEFQERNLVNIQRANTNMLGHRLKKYLLRYGYAGVTESSRPFIMDWIRRQRELGPEWYREGRQNAQQNNYNMPRQLKFFVGDETPLTDSELLYMVGMFEASFTTKEKYVSRDIHDEGAMYADWAKTSVEDAAMLQILKRNGTLDIKGVRL